jgi:hypothetical protein
MIKRRTLVLMLLLPSGGALADDFLGQASFVDGDTLEIHGIRIRLWGVDARRAASSAARQFAISLWRAGSKRPCASIRANGKPAACSDDANAHP